MTTTPVFPLEGGCDCGQVRYRMQAAAPTRQPWVVLAPGTPAVPEYYRREEYWPHPSLARYQGLAPAIRAWPAARREQRP